MLALAEHKKCSAVILAGGQNSRMGGRNKAFIKIGGKTILQRLLEILRDLFAEIVLVTRHPAEYQGLGLVIVEDMFPQRSSLTGLHAGLTQCSGDFAFVVPCDAPFIQTELVRILLQEIEQNYDVITPEVKGYYQPLCAVYSKRCLHFIEAQLQANDFKIVHFFYHLLVKTIEEKRIRDADPTLYSFLNVNTPAEQEASQRILDQYP